MGDMDRRQRPEDMNLPSYGLNLGDGPRTEEMLQRIRSNQGLFGNGVQPTAGPSGVQPSDDTIQVIVQNTEDYDEQIRGLNFSAATEPIVTVEASQIMEQSREPQLTVDMKVSYMRFRYTSEKAKKKKGPKNKPFDDFDVDEKNVFAEITLLNYDGAAKIVAYCVNEEGLLHPFNLFGDNCHNGVYVLRHKFRSGRTSMKMKKVSVTTPKAKEYAENRRNQLRYLAEVGIHDVKFCKEVQDKQLVYIKVTVILEGMNNQTVAVISTPIQNKKKGEEFKIEDVEPVTAPACGIHTNNITKNRIMLHVTEKTAFPSEVGVKIREKDRRGIVRWEKDLHGKDHITTIKQCVVKFIPPPYRYPNTTEDVEVEMCLYDRTTKIETEPVKIVYKGSENCNLCSVGPLTKKRKLDEDEYLNNASGSFDVKKSSMHIKNFLDSCTQESNPSSADESYEEPGVVEEEEMTVSLGGKQTSFTSYSSMMEEASQPEQGHSGSLLVTSVSTHDTSYQVPVSHTTMAGTSVSSSYDPGTTVVVSANQHIPHVSASQSYRQDNEQTNISLGEPDVNSGQIENTDDQQSGNPQYSIALINGQIYFVNDDTRGISNATTHQTLQNIGDQQVLVQSLPPQQPSTGEQDNSATCTTENLIHILSEPESQSQLQQLAQQQQQQQQMMQYQLQLQQLQQQSPPPQQQQEQQLNRQQQKQQLLAQMIDLIKRQPTPELQMQMTQMIASAAVPQQNNTPPASMPTQNTGNEFNSMDLNDNDLEIDGAANASGPIPKCVEEESECVKLSNGSF